MAAEEAEGVFGSGAAWVLEYAESEEVSEVALRFVAVSESIEHVFEFGVGVAESDGGTEEVGFDVGVVVGEGFLADGGVDADMAVGVHDFPGGFDETGLNMNPCFAAAFADGLINFIDEEAGRVMDGSEFFIEEGFGVIDEAFCLADGEVGEFLEDDGGGNFGAEEPASEAFREGEEFGFFVGGDVSIVV